jgi:type II secretory pathway pseudopilin PulG
MDNAATFGQWRPSAQRTGFSLFEIFLVIAILSALIAISWPMLRRPLNQSIVQDAAQQVQQDLLSARLQAIQTGRAWLVQWRPGTPSYYIGTTDQRLDPAARESRSARPFEPSDAGGSEFAAAATPQGNEVESLRELPVGTFFVAIPSADRGEASLALPEESFDEIASESAVAGADMPWSAPIRFYPSGRFLPGSIEVGSEQGLYAAVALEGLAGRITVSPPQR